MKKHRKCISVIAVIFVFAAFLSLGCTPAKRPIPETNRYDNKVVPRENRYDTNQNMTDMYDNDTIPDRYGDQNDLTYDNIPKNMDNYGINEKGENVTLEREIERMSGIEDAVVILDRNTCYVGVDTDTGTPVENMKATQTTIASKVREKMPNVSRVYVTSEEDRVKRLRGFRTNIMNGRDVRDFVDQIQDLF
ncbi:YhcN/YlaJ family sporulation lipoprotein [Crassaminicella profunda]|uniref:YhcN/YlaJ family sporulation lipoprotein n=1 Tax=Crassaminicella profunda TaxID=1286698 RepID=UPI001CA66E25|nr:YhcN/YlaJ family sporulation lipoprotein [Crassaminicella profunda]QZY55422.1 YhcN/YlaJ family sporulation lipoprotein [Crassaminicella profunda]